MSSLNAIPSPLAEALTNENIALSSPKALRALPIGSSWPGLSSPVAPSDKGTTPSGRQKGNPIAKRLSKLLPGEKDPQPSFCSSRRELAELGGLFRRHDDALVRSPIEPSNVAGPSGHYSAAVENIKQLSSTDDSFYVAGPSRSQNVNAGRCKQPPPPTESSSAVARPSPRHQRRRSHNVIGTAQSPLSLRPLNYGPSWSDFNEPPSSPSSSGSWVTARGEEIKDHVADEEGKMRKYGVI